MMKQQKPTHPPKTNDPVKYHCHDSCNACGGVNEINVTASCGGHMEEAKTKCKTCGHEDYWAHGFFEGSEEVESKCRTYSFT
ncbi:MAG: hypothetical protein JKY81_00140 [Colwellia sp.]|nr:hypothetical protein [Colwellia sp.]